MNIKRLISRKAVANAHSPRQSRFRSESLSVHKVAPSSDKLSQHDSGHYHIRHFEKSELFMTANNIEHYSADYNAAVYRKSAVPYRYNIVKRMKFFQIEEHIIESGTYNGRRNHDYRKIKYAVKIHSRLSRAVAKIGESEYYSQTNYHSVPCDFQFSYMESDSAYGKLAYSEPRKRYFRYHILLPSL